MGAPSPELCNLWLAHAFNSHDVEAAAAMYHPQASIVQVDQVHGGTRIARGADGIRETMAAYIGMEPHMDVITHHLESATRNLDEFSREIRRNPGQLLRSPEADKLEDVP